MANHQRLKLLAEHLGVLPDKEYLQQEAHELNLNKPQPEYTLGIFLI